MKTLHLFFLLFIITFSVQASGEIAPRAYDFSSGFKAYDLNKSGFIERVEFEDHLLNHFSSLDLDRNALLSPKELAAGQEWAKRIGQVNTDLNVINYLHGIDVFFDNADIDKNRKLSQKEFETKLFPLKMNLRKSQKKLARICVGDIDHQARGWILFEKNNKSKLVRRYTTLVPHEQTWTCVPLPSKKVEYLVHVEMMPSKQDHVCEVAVKPNEWIIIQGSPELKCVSMSKKKI